MEIFPKVKIYALVSSENPELIRYIGKTTRSLGERLRNHRSGAKNKTCGVYVGNWINSVIKSGYKLEIILLDEVEHCIWEEAEKGYIKLFKSLGAKLTNHQIGGGFCGTRINGNNKGERNGMYGKFKENHPKFNYKPSEETLKKMSESRTGKLRKDLWKPVLAEDKDGNILEFAGAQDFAAFVGAKKCSVLVVLCGERKSIYGYKLSYKKKEEVSY